jgi:hypothetical protein
LLEYMACRRPVIAAAVPGVGEVLRDEHDGLLYPPGDDETLAAAILEVLGSSKTAERLSEGGYRRVRDLFSSGARRRRVASIYAQVLPGLDGGDPWVDDFEEEEVGPSESDIAAAEAALRGEIEPSGTGMEAVEALEPSVPDLEPLTSEPGIESEPGTGGDPGLESEPGMDSDPGLHPDLAGVDEDLASEPTTAFSITDVGLESPTTNPRIDTDPGAPIAAERTHPGR